MRTYCILISLSNDLESQFQAFSFVFFPYLSSPWNPSSCHPELVSKHIIYFHTSLLKIPFPLFFTLRSAGSSQYHCEAFTSFSPQTSHIYLSRAALSSCYIIIIYVFVFSTRLWAPWPFGIRIPNIDHHLILNGSVNICWNNSQKLNLK